MHHWRVLIVCLLVACFGLTAMGAPRKVRVDDSAEIDELMARGGKIVADYGSFKLMEADDESPAVRRRAERNEQSEDSDVIELYSRKLDTRRAEVKAMRRPVHAFAGRRLHLIQFAGPVKPEWREAVESFGVKVITYVPQNAYLVRGDSAALIRMQSWLNVTNIAQWDGEFADDFKIHPAASTLDENGLSRVPDTDVFAIQMLEDSEVNTATLALIDQLKLAPIKRQFQTMQYLNVIVRLPPERLPEIAARSEVVSIQPYIDPQPRDERQDQIIAGNLSGGLPTGPGYLAWLMGRGFTQAQFDASAFAVDISDSGVDNGTTVPGHFGLYTGGNPFSASRVIYNRVEGTPHGGSTTAGCDGHGTLNAHIIMGYNDAAAGFPHTDSVGYRYGLGVCPFVRLGSSVIFDPDLFTSPNYANLQSKAYQDGARISANSWGATNNTYTVDAQAYDALVRDAQPAGSTFATAGNQQMVIIFAAGNKGSGANTVGSPGTAKNVITVGASENVRSLSTANGGNSSFGSDGCGLTDSGADNANDIASFSSRGPCSDGRQKPDIVAPGTHITGGVGQNSTNTGGNGTAISCFKASGVAALPGAGGCGTPSIGNPNNFFPLGQQFYTVSSGTSHSTPAVAGACALLRQYFINSSLNAPSPAMTKAFLMNSTRYLTGVSANDNLWSPNQGMGELNLGTAFDGTARVLRDQLPPDKFTATGQTRIFAGRISDTGKPVRVTLAWTDAPGSTIGNAFNNDLDLTVTVGGVTYKGNIFSGEFSAAGGVADTRNNVENIFLPAGTAGTIAVKVTAANINSDGVPNEAPSMDQDFALVIYNVEETNAPVILNNGYAVAVEGCFPTNSAVDAGETLTVNFAFLNVGTTATTNLVATLLATNGVISPSNPQNYGVVSAGGAAVSRSFTFTASGSCGGSVNPVFHLQDGALNLGTVSVAVPVGLTVVQANSATNSTAITIPTSGTASLYPSTISISGITGTVSKVTATLRGFTHTFPDDVDVLLVGPAGQKVLLMSDAGGSADVSNLTLTFDDSAASMLPNNSSFSSGTWKPSNYDTSSDNFPSVSGPFSSVLSVFNGVNPNGTWSLYIQDDMSGDGGSLTQGWSLSITTSNLYCCNSALNLADIEVKQSISAPVINIGSNVIITLTVTNHGPDPTAFVTLTNLLPPGLNFVSAVASQGACTNESGVVHCSLEVLNPGATATVTIVATASATGKVTNFVSVVGGTIDPVSANNSSSVALMLNGFPMISDIPDQIIVEDTPTGYLPFIIGDAETDVTNLTLAVESTVTNLVPMAAIALGGGGSNRTLNILPALNLSGSATITVTVSDGFASASDSFVLTVLPTNDPPVLTAISNRFVVEGGTLVVTNVAVDEETPVEALMFTLLNGPAGAGINPTNGVLTWTTTEANGPGTNEIVVSVSDDGVPSQSATQSFTVIVLETNSPPVLAAYSNHVIVEGETIIIPANASDPDLPTNQLTFSFGGIVPTGVELNPTNGVFTWTPDESQGGTTNLITVIVTDNGSPSFSATQTLAIIVLESNQPPVLVGIADRMVHAGSLIQFTNSASDPDVPPGALTFSLDAGAPAAASIDATSGLFTWLTTDADANTTNGITVRVTDDGLPPQSDARTFVVTVVARPFITGILITNDVVSVTWTALPGQGYELQFTTNLPETNWSTVLPDVTATGDSVSHTNVFNPIAPQFYRVKVLP